MERAIRVIEKAMASKSAGEQEAWKRLRKQFLENLSPPSASTLLDLDVKQAVRLAGECHRMQVDLEASLGHPLDEHVRLKNRQTLHKYPYWQRGASLKRSTRRFGRLVIGYKFVGDRVRINHLHSVK